MANENDVVRYQDFIEEDGSLDKLIAKIEEVGEKYTKMISKVSEDAKKLAENIAKLDVAQDGHNGTLSDYEKQLLEIEATKKKLTKAEADNAVELAKQKELLRQRNAQNKAQAKEEIAQQKLTKNNQALIQKSIKLINDEKTSYELLSAQYTKMKIAVNALSVEYREQTAEGQALVKNTNQVYQQMIKLQSVTGKNTLQVGDYSKATYGLNANINNLTRELPNLGVSASTFFLSISNNLPMLKDSIDQIKRTNIALAKEGLATTSVWRQLSKSIFSWNTVISIAVALLTVYGAKLVKWIQTRREANKEIDEAVELQKELNRVNAEAEKQAVDNTTRLKLLYEATQDQTRSEEERLAAIKELKSEYPDYFKGLTDEEVLAGKAAVAYDKLTKSIVATARARAYEQEITKKQKEIIQLEEDKKVAQEEYTKAAQKYDKTVKNITKNPIAPFIIPGRAKKAISEYEDIQDIQNDIALKNKEIEALSKGIDLFALTDEDPAGGNRKSSDPVLEALQDQRDLISLQQDGMKKELELQQNQLAIELHNAKGNQEKITALNEWGQREIAAIKKKYADEEEKIEDDTYKAEEEALNNSIKAEAELTKKQQKELRTRYKNEVTHLQSQADIEDLKIDMSNATDEEKTKLRLENELDYYRKLLALSKEMQGQMSEDEMSFLITKIESIKAAIAKATGGESGDGFWSKLGIDLGPDQKRAIQDSISFSISHLQELAAAELAVAEAATAAADERVKAAQSAVDAEIEARNNGYANSVDTAQKELALANQSRQKALQDEAKAKKKMIVLDSLTQASNLITATTSLLESPFTWPLIPVMWGTFFAAKSKAFQATEPVTYGDGGSEFLDYGGSHASGNDIDIGRTADGRARRAERGEMLSVINRRSTAKYRKHLPGIIDSLNKGKFFEKYGNSYEAAGMAMNFHGQAADLSKLEGDVAAMRKANERKVFTDSRGNRIEIYKNLKRTYRAN